MASRRLLLAASAVALVSAQGAIPGCTTNSFNIPSWWLSDFQSGNDGSTFKLVNRANNATTDVSCKPFNGNPTSTAACTLPDSASWSPEPNPVTLSMVTPVGKEPGQIVVNIQQQWQCNDRSRLYFVAEGNSTLDVTCTNTNCTTTNPQILIRGSLTTPVYVTPDYAAGPPGHSKAGCLAAAENATWSVSRVDVRELTGDGLNPDDYRTVEALVVNDFTGYMASCFLGNAETGALNCAGVEFQGNTGERYRISTSGTWNKADNSIRVAQTWFCDDMDPARPVSVSAAGSARVNLTCTDKALNGIPNGNSRACESDEAATTVKGTLESTSPLPPYSLTDPIVQADSCTVASILDPKWSFSNFAITTVNNVSAVQFNVILAAPRRGFAYPIQITQDMNAADPNADDGFYPCLIAEQDPSVSPMWPMFCEVRYVAAEKRLTMRAEWNCSDLDVKRPTHFMGSVDTVVKSEFICEDIDGTAFCMTENPGLTWSEPITGVQWFPVAYPEDE